VVVENPLPSPEHRLYKLLSEEEPASAHSRYNALVRRLVSYERAAECARDEIEEEPYRYPALDAASFRRRVEETFLAR
jgi:hypothetical protein